MKDALTGLQEGLQNELTSMRGRKADLEKQLREFSERITHTEGRLFEVTEILEYMEKQEGNEDADNTAGRDAGTTEAGGQQQVD